MAPSPTIRRLLRETAELSSSAASPNAAFYAAPVSDADLHEWHFILLGPPAPSPYAGGLYHGRITLPPTYPLKPPNFRFLTPSGRFEVNREICLSISGFHEETWMPAWGVRTALTALRTFMAEQGSAGQVGGLEASKEVRERLARESRSWRCDSCGGKTNLEMMEQWWEFCRTKGVKICADGKEVDLEILPEDMTLEARDPSNKSKPDEGADSPDQAVLDNKQGPTSTSRENKGTSALSSVTSGPVSGPESTAVSSVSTSQTRQRTVLVSPTSIAAPAAQNLPTSTPAFTELQPAEIIRPDPGNTATIDKAIGAIVLALCLMILKKIFYPAQAPSLEEFYLPEG